jgi:hypothetical protein
MSDEKSEDRRARKLHVLDGRRLEPPCKLDAAGSGLWARIVSSYDFSDIGGQEILALACASLDRAENLKSLIDQDGAIIKTRGGFRANPLLPAETAARGLAIRTLIRLGINSEPLRCGPGRPPSGAVGITRW